jgi:hypothetical protein
MKWTTHVLYLVVVFSLFHTNNYYKKNYHEYMKEYYKTYDELLDMKFKDNEAMVGWSTCLSEKADETHSKTVCDNQLYDLRDWLRKCKCKCTGFEGK